MIGTDIIQKFREENPELDVNVIPDTVLASWLLTGDQEVCMKVRLINAEDQNITPVAGQKTYDLTKVNSLFFDIDEMPGGGVCQYPSNNNYKRLTKTTKSELDANKAQWRMASQGVPKYYYRSGNSIVVYPTPDTTIVNMTADLILLSNPYTNMSVMPFNQLPYLAPFHYSLVLYLQWRAKIKIGKTDEGTAAYNLYNTYVQWMIKTIGGGKYGPIEFRPSGLPSGSRQR